LYYTGFMWQGLEGGCKDGFCEKAPGVAPMLDSVSRLQDGVLHFLSHFEVFGTRSRLLISTR